MLELGFILKVLTCIMHFFLIFLYSKGTEHFLLLFYNSKPPPLRDLSEFLYSSVCFLLAIF